MKKIFVSFVAGILLGLALVPSGMNAQCPTNIVPDSVSWTQNPNFIIYPLPSGCTIYVAYCFRQIQLIDTILGSPHEYDVNEFYIDSVFADTSCSSHYDPQDLIAWALIAVKDSAAQGFDPCGPADTAWGYGYKSNCWKMQVWNPTLNGYFPCGDGSSHCVLKCPPCPTGGSCVYSVQGTVNCPNPPSVWVANTCYNVGCDAPRGPH